MMRQGSVLLATAIAAFAIVATTSARQSGDSGYTPQRINKAIELLEAGEPVYYFQFPGGGYEDGRRFAQTWADAIGYNVEQAPFSTVEFKAFMQGLIDGGPTKSGHRTPAVIVTLPVGGIDEATVRANYWMVEQVLAAGAHGVLAPSLIVLRRLRDVRQHTRTRAVVPFRARTRGDLEQRSKSKADPSFGFPRGCRSRRVPRSVRSADEG